MRLTLVLITGLLALAFLHSLRAHAPGESSLVIARDDEALELRLVLSLASAAALLSPEATPPLEADTFDQHRPALVAAASQGLLLRDAAGAALKPERVIATFRNAHEVHLDFFFPTSSRPASLALPLLARIGREVWCEVTDLNVSPSARTVLLPASPEMQLAR